MEFNKIIRGAKREVNNLENVYAILDAGFLCHVAFRQHEQTMMIPTAYGRSGDTLYLHGSVKNSMLRQILDGQTACICVTHLDGIVLAKSLFYSSVNYRSVILFGKATLAEGDNEKLEGLKIITENIVKGRWNEVNAGDKNQLNATMVIKFTIESASAKVRSGGPAGDDEITSNAWSGVIPLAMKALPPLTKDNSETEISNSVNAYYQQFK